MTFLTASAVFSTANIDINLQRRYLQAAGMNTQMAGQPFQNPLQKKTYNWEGKTVLIAEDEEFNFLYLREILAPTKVRVIRALDGEMAVNICQTEKIDIVLMDIKMPRMNGLEATKLIRTFNEGLPVIAQTAYAMVEDSEKCLGAGCTHYLTKPISSKVLLGLVEQYLK